MFGAGVSTVWDGFKILIEYIYEKTLVTGSFDNVYEFNNIRTG